jgi:predicted nucleic acid-binding protein
LIHLDTSFLIHAMRRGSNEDSVLRSWIQQGLEIGISVVAWTEFRCGPAAPQIVTFAQRIVGDLIPFDGSAADLAAQLFNHNGRRRGTLMDCMIAASAITNRARLATSNPSDFVRLTSAGLDLAHPS